MFSGKLLAVIAAKTEPGEIKLEVSAEGMDTVAVSMEALACGKMTGVSAGENISAMDTCAQHPHEGKGKPCALT